MTVALDSQCNALAVAVISIFAMPSHALASFMMFCELTGDVVSSPVRSEVAVEFGFLVRAATDLPIVDGSPGKTDCPIREGERLAIVLAIEDSGHPASIAQGASITLERYDVDVQDDKGAIVRSIKYVRRENQEVTAPANERQPQQR